MADSILYFIQFSFFYFLYLVFIPAKVMKLPLTGKGVGENIIKAMAASHVVIISWVYLLGICHIYYTGTLVLAIVITILVYWKVQGVCYRKCFLRFMEWTALVSGGQYKASVFWKRALKKAGTSFGNTIKAGFRRAFPRNIISCVVLLISFASLIQRKWSLVFDNYAYLTSDMYVHNEWINYMEQGDIFYDGIYPFGMHNMISAFHKLSGLSLNVVFRYWGAYNCLLMVVMMYFFARKIFKGKYTALVPVFIYCVTDFASYTYGYRTIYTLPQEVGMLFLLPCAYFFGKFLEEEKKEDGIYFALCASIVLSCHFFTVIFAVILCGAMCIPFIKKVFCPRILKKLLLYVLLIVLLSITPFALGKLCGKYWQGSMGWAMGVMNSSGSSQTQQDTQPQSAQIELGLQEEEEQQAQAAEAKPSVTVKLKDIAEELYRLQVDDMNSYWGKVFWICMGLFVLYALLRVILRKMDWEFKMYTGVFFFMVFVVIMYSYWILGIPKIMKEERMTIFIGYMTPFLLALPLEIIARAFQSIWKRGAAIDACCSIAVVGLLGYVTYGLGYLPVQSYFFLEDSLAAKACVKINEEFPKDTWTVVSPVEELSFIRNRGYHYELWEFISSMELYDEERYLEIPTRYVFFVLEKKPIVYNQFRYSYMDFEFEPLDKEDAKKYFTREMLGISSTGMMKFYNNLDNRRIMEAKLACWLEEYEKAFPEQMEIYMEDEECVIYKFEQNPYMNNNFAIDYGYNRYSPLKYYRELRMRMKERGEDTTEVDATIQKLLSGK